MFENNKLIIISYRCVSEFVTAKLYFICNTNMGTDGTFYMFAVISLLSAVFVYFFIRESENKTLAEIQDLYKEKRNFINC